MTPALTSLVSALTLATAAAPAHSGSDARLQPSFCSLMGKAQCANGPSQAMAGLVQLARADNGWVVSQTTSPIDYSPIATATTASRGDTDAPPMQLAIRCRGGQTELAVTGPAVTGRGDTYSISYRINNARPVQLAGARAAFGEGVAFKGDVVTLLQQLPAEGDLAVHLRPFAGRELDGVFSLNGLDALRVRIGEACRWPHAVAKPNDR